MASGIDLAQPQVQQQPSQLRPPPMRSSLYRASFSREYPSSYDVANASAWYPEERSNRPMPSNGLPPHEVQPPFPSRKLYVSRNRSNTAAQSNGNANGGAVPLQRSTASPPSHSPTNESVAANASTSSNEAVDTSTNGTSAGPNAEDVPTNRPLFLNPHTGTWSHGSRSQVSSRCPFMLQDRNRRYNIGSGSHYSVVHQFPYALQNNPYHPVRPAYAPHENLWYRQQNNQEMHRRHLMTSGGHELTTNTGPITVPSAFERSEACERRFRAQFRAPANVPAAAAPSSNAVYCLSCDHQHPTGMSHQPNPHRRIRAYVCSDRRNVFIGR